MHRQRAELPPVILCNHHNTTAVLETQTGDLENAARQFEFARKYGQDNLEENHEATAIATLNLAKTRRKMGVSADGLYSEGVAILEKKYGRERIVNSTRLPLEYGRQKHVALICS